MTKGVYRRQTGEETSAKLTKLKILQDLPLAKKIEISEQIIDLAKKMNKKACLLFSGGKDSTVLLHLLKKNKVEFFAMYNNTTLGDPAADQFTREIVKKFDIEYIETTASDPVEIWKKTGYYPILSKRGFTKYKKKNPNLRISPVQCCYQLKEKYCNYVLKERSVELVFWGNRAGESLRRKFSFVDNGFLFKPKKYNWFQCYPLQHWNRSDIIDYLNKHVPDYPVDNRLEAGCLCCGTDIQFKTNALKKLHDTDFEKWLYYMRNGFGAEILKIKGIEESRLEEVLTNKKEILFRI